jgi:hypothetical protein
MQVGLEINDNKASFFVELIRNFSIVKDSLTIERKRTNNNNSIELLHNRKLGGKT